MNLSLNSPLRAVLPTQYSPDDIGCDTLGSFAHP
ncbi:Uncharacterised protein [Vibrio cholerae]|nr:Uncharacterised protein [Vibrio cholerae]